MYKKYVINKLFFLIILFILSLFHNQKLFATSSEWVNYDQGKVRLISAKLNNNSNFYLGLHFIMLPDWKTFWRSPGEAGYPLEFKYNKSKNILFNEIMWPYPERFNFSGIYTYGYSKEVVLPIKFDVIDKKFDADISIEINFLTCSDVCIPKKIYLSLPIPKEAHGDNYLKLNQDLLAKYLQRVPKRVEKSSVNNKIYFIPKSEESVLKINIDSIQGFKNPDVFVETGTELNFDKPRLIFTETGKVLEFELPIKDIDTVNIESLLNQPVVVTFINFGKAEEYNLDVEIVGNKHSSSSSLWVIIILAVAGGLILNFMPCVLPILTLKVLSLLDKESLGYNYIRFSFFGNILGIIFTFLVLALLIIIFRFLGINLGWGFHFQEPIFTFTVLVIILFFSLNLFDLVQIKLPFWIFSSLGKNANQKESNNFRFSFFNGIFSTILATPCTAPIIGTTVTFALQNSSFKVFLIFLAMGLGMSLPLLVIIIFPNLISYIPKSGKWTLNLKKFLGFLLLLTAFWLLVVLINQIDLSVLIILLVIMFLIFLLFIKNDPLQIISRNLYLKLIVLVAIPLITIPIILFSDKVEPEKTNRLLDLQTDNINKYLSSGKLVFVDITAEWCITCKVNKFLVLDTNEVRKVFENENVIYIEIDWTKRDSKILDFINSFDRSGIPLNIIYGKFTPKGITLPEILTKKNLYRSIQVAKGSKIIVEK
ncbi:MAG: Thiol:disulfide interchange protein DsbD [Alphaproteobacteria bacterium MarineAlpha2_Bin1]|nr:MAG: Thiol:disulfide interchange protein DsbD [Alphaproteobacteria bacterium MarineAlpha2_Bin1]